MSRAGDFFHRNVEDPFDFAASLYRAKATGSTFDKVDPVEFDFVTTVYRALLVYLFYSGPDLVLPLHLTNC